MNYRLDGEFSNDFLESEASTSGKSKKMCLECSILSVVNFNIYNFKKEKRLFQNLSLY